MIASIAGVLQARGPDHAVVAVGGIGFRVFVPGPTLAALGRVGDQVQLSTMLYVRQEQLALYGFADDEQLRLFELLLGVTGVGPKGALAVLSGAPIELLESAVATGNAELLGRVPGVGKKTLARIVVELKGKLPAPSVVEAAKHATHDAEVLLALTGLGYSHAEALAAVQSLPDDGFALEKRITEALRFLAGR